MLYGYSSVFCAHIDQVFLGMLICVKIWWSMQSDLPHTADEEISMDMSILDEKHQEMVSLILNGYILE